MAEVAETHDVTYHLEHLNTKLDQQGYPLAYIEDIVRLRDEVGSLRIWLLLDFYHAQIEEGNLVELVWEYHEFIGYVQMADVSGRHEPGTGQIKFPRLVDALREVGYDGIVGIEAFPESKDQDEILRQFRELFE